ncbi:MAG: hypothetical protein FJ009_13890 [Chloroflexi bacterium]|nr:hypothetical protein [Chloroflexota bacterium]
MFLSTRRLFTAILFLALCVIAAREISDPDFWWHLRTGQFIFETRAIPHTDIFSFTNEGRPWVTHEWLSEVVIYALYALGSFPALMLTFAAIIALTFAFVYARTPGKPYIAAFAVLLAALAAAPTFGARPQMLTLLLGSIFLYVLDKRRDLLWLLPPLTILWVNLHSGYALGLVIVAVYLFGEIVAAVSGQRSAVSPRQLGIIFALCLGAVLFNPNGAAMYVYPFETLTSRAMQAYIQEWFSPDFHQIEFQPFAWLLIGTLAAMAFAGKRITLTQTILLAGFTLAALRSARNIPIFAIIAAPILAEQLWHLIAARMPPENRRVTRGMAIVNWLILALVIAASAARVGMIVLNQSAVERAKYPAAAVEFLHTRAPRGALYNEYGWGGYVIWRLYPATRVFIDGRADVYGDAFIEDVYLKAYRGGADWRAPLEQYAVRVVLIEPGAPLAAQLARDPEWQSVYADRQAVVFEKR